MEKQSEHSGAPELPSFGRYRLLEQLGRGGMASVYRAEMVGLGGFSKIVALKVVHAHLAVQSEFTQGFIGEARLGGNLSHPNIVETLDFGESEGRLYLALEYVHGTTLEQVIEAHDRNGVPIPPEAALHLLIQVCHGLGYAHRATGRDGQPLRMIHRDLKPSNILLSTHGQVKITDFGVARAESNLVRTHLSGVLKGTLRYMSPEQAWGERSLDHRSDLFTVGLLLYELLMLEPLYAGGKAESVLRRAQDGKVGPRLELLPESPVRGQLIEFLKKALAAAPEERFQSAGEMAAAMESILQAIPNARPFASWIEQAVREAMALPSEELKAPLQPGQSIDLGGGGWGQSPRVTGPRPALAPTPPSPPRSPEGEATLVSADPRPRGIADVPATLVMPRPPRTPALKVAEPQPPRAPESKTAEPQPPRAPDAKAAEGGAVSSPAAFGAVPANPRRTASELATVVVQRAETRPSSPPVPAVRPSPLSGPVKPVTPEAVRQPSYLVVGIGGALLGLAIAGGMWMASRRGPGPVPPVAGGSPAVPVAPVVAPVDPGAAAVVPLASSGAPPLEAGPGSGRSEPVPEDRSSQPSRRSTPTGSTADPAMPAATTGEVAPAAGTNPAAPAAATNPAAPAAVAARGEQPPPSVSASREPARKAPAEAGAGAPARGATLFLNSRPESSIRVNGRRLSEFPVQNFAVPAGSHTLSFELGDGRKLEQTVTIEVGATLRCTAAFEAGEVRCRRD